MTFSWGSGGVASVLLVVLVVAFVPAFLRYDGRPPATATPRPEPSPGPAGEDTVPR